MKLAHQSSFQAERAKHYFIVKLDEKSGWKKSAETENNFKLWAGQFYTYNNVTDKKYISFLYVLSNKRIWACDICQ